MEPVVVCEFKTTVDIKAPFHTTPEGRKVWRAINEFNVGRETVPLEEEWPEGKHGPMEKIHWNLAITHRREITVEVMSNGTLRIKEFH